MENFTSPATAEQARKTVREAQALGADLKKDFEGAAAQGRDVVEEVADDAKRAFRPASARARDAARAAGRRLARTARRVGAYTGENPVVFAVVAFGAGLLLGHLVSRER